MQNNLIFNLKPDLAQAHRGAAAALVVGGAGAPVNFRPWEGAGEIQLSEAKLVVGSVGSGVVRIGRLGGGGGTGRLRWQRR
jgi:hypothetical protein